MTATESRGPTARAKALLGQYLGDVRGTAILWPPADWALRRLGAPSGPARPPVLVDPDCGNGDALLWAYRSGYSVAGTWVEDHDRERFSPVELHERLEAEPRRPWRDYTLCGPDARHARVGVGEADVAWWNVPAGPFNTLGYDMRYPQLGGCVEWRKLCYTDYLRAVGAVLLTLAVELRRGGHLYLWCGLDGRVPRPKRDEVLVAAHDVIATASGIPNLLYHGWYWATKPRHLLTVGVLAEFGRNA